MSTKTDKYSFIEQNFKTSENQYYNLDLNQSKKCAILVPVQSYSKTKEDKYCAYENSNEAVVSDLFVNENIKGLKTEEFGPIKKRCFTDALKSQNPFKFSRQQNVYHRNEPEIMQFKASQLLSDSHRPPSSQQIGNNDGHIVRPQMSPGAGTAVSFSLN
uniref:Uncharacterized protein n=1 Tax=Panagrolaimus davidi TaxID=227884 RepID=A0A914QNL5_9BILA